MPNFQARTRQIGTPKRIPQTIGHPPEYDYRVREIRDAPFIALTPSDVMENERILDDSADIAFTDGGPKASLSFHLTLTGIGAGSYGGGLKVPVIQFDAKGRAIAASEATLGTAAALDADNDATLSANSAVRVPTQAAVKAFVEQSVAGLLEYKGDLDCSASPNYPAALKGDSYIVSVAGKIGGASGKAVDAGDFIICRADNAGGNEASVGTLWFVLEHNLAGVLLAANNLADVSNPATARSNLGLAIGSDVQAFDSDLAAIAALTTTAFGRAVLALADAAAFRTYIGAGTGTVTSVQASGGTTGLTFSGGPISGAGTLTLGGTLGVGAGGTGATSITAGYLVRGNGASAMGPSGVYDDGAGNISIGDTSTGGYKFAVIGNFGQLVKSTGGSSNEAQVIWNNATTGNNILCYFATEGSITVRGSITYNRGAGLIAYNTTSDYRSKVVHGPLSNSGEVIDRFKVYLGTMRAATQARPMLVAHEAHEVAPYCVTGEKDAVDKNGDPVFQQMDHSSLVPLLIAEIQSLRARVAALEKAQA